VSAVDLAVARSKINEGFRARKYIDPRGFESIGYGFNIDAGITQRAAAALLAAQAQEIGDSLSAFAWYPADETRRSVFIELAFNLGINGLLHFPATLHASAAGDWQGAHDQLLNSDAARELPARYKALATILLTGVSNGPAT
jgi:lysozyme